MKNGSFRTRLGFAIAGWRLAYKEERSLRTHVLFALAAGIALLVMQPPAIWWALVIVVCALVIATELVNTALERLTDHLHPAIHPSIKAVKDIAAAAVLVASGAALIVAALLFIGFLRGN